MRHMKAIAFALAAVMLASFAPVLFAENADADADYTFYRYTIKYYSTSTDAMYLIWDFADGTVLDGRWEYYIQQQNDGAELSAEILAGIDAYKDLLEENGNSIFCPIHTYGATGVYTYSITAINPIGYVSPLDGMTYDGTFATDTTGFDGGLISGSEETAVRGSWDTAYITLDVRGYPTITFETNGASPIADLVVHNTSEYTSAVAPAEPELDGYDFTGWYLDEECTELYDWSSLVTAPVTLYAGWHSDTAPMLKNHVITFKDGTTTIDNQNVKSADESVTTNINVENPTKNGYTFKGWSLTADGQAQYLKGATIILDTDGLTLYAVWDVIPAPEKITVIVDGNSVQMDEGKKVSDLTVPVKDGYTFDGWYADAEFTQKLDPDTALTGGFTAYAHFVDASEEKQSSQDTDWIPWIVLAIGAVVFVVGFRYHPVIVVIGGVVMAIAGLDIGGIFDLF